MKKWYAFVLATFLPSVCLAQTTTQSPIDSPTLAAQSKQSNKKIGSVAVKQKSKKSSITKFSMSMIEGDHIDLRYAGLPIAEVINGIEKLTDLKKGEFESTADFNARKAVALTKKILGDSSVDDTFAFVVPVTKRNLSDRGLLLYEFNADTSELNLFAFGDTSPLNGIGAPDYQGTTHEKEGLYKFRLDFKLNSTRTYQASNAYGASVSVEETISTSLGVAANKIPLFLSYNPTVQLNMKNAIAAKELPSLKALVVMKLDALPYVVYNFKHSTPTRDDPTEFTNSEKYLTGNILGFVFYSGLTGEIFARLPDNFGKPEPKPEPKLDANPAVL